MVISDEKAEILRCRGNVLVTANPGTGKTTLLANKYISLINEKVAPEQILCLTFTEKAKKEMENRILRILEERNIGIDISKMRVHTFHSYALDNIENDEIISSNLLRYTIYRYLRDHEILNYSDDYLINDIVPGMEGHISYLKSFGVTPEQIDLDKVKGNLKETAKYEKDELDKFAEYFLDIYKHYEEVKDRKGIDYSDMLIKFLHQKKIPRFEYVLVDELQDVNSMEADIALRSGGTFFAVGDKKQAIFGFQGGSIINFGKFSNSTSFVLGDNFRSSNEVLEYAKAFFGSKTKDKSHVKELAKLHNPDAGACEKPKIYAVGRENIPKAVCALIQKMPPDHRIAVITRTNYQITNVSAEMKSQKIEHTTTYFRASEDARMHIAAFLKGIVSNDVRHVKNSMFTPFFPISLQNAFELAQQKGVTIDIVCERCPAFGKLRASVKNVEDVGKLFRENIMPVAITYGKEYFLAAKTVQNALRESIAVLDDINLDNVSVYLDSADLIADEAGKKARVVVTTAHKAKGLEFDSVIYLPSKPKGRTDFQDDIVKAILKTKDIDATEELEEETLRIDFVALTRAKRGLHILTDKPEDYLNDLIERAEVEIEGVDDYSYTEKAKRAYNLFLSGDDEAARNLLEDKRPWIRQFVKAHFEKLDQISFSALVIDPYDYFVDRVLGVSDFTPALKLGGDVHEMARKLVKGESFEPAPEMQPYYLNLKTLMSEIQKEYPETIDAEVAFKVQLSKVVLTAEQINFVGKVDAIFKNSDSYLIVDWKTDKSEDRGSEHRRQLEAYRMAVSEMMSIPREKIRVAIGYIGLTGRINLGKIEAKLDMLQPAKSAAKTFADHVGKILAWKANPDLLLDKISEDGGDEILRKSIIEQYLLERDEEKKQSTGQA